MRPRRPLTLSLKLITMEVVKRRWRWRRTIEVNGWGKVAEIPRVKKGKDVGFLVKLDWLSC